MLHFTQKYIPKSCKDIIGQDDALKKLRDFIASFPKAKKRAVLLYGQSGTGKTSSVYAIANDLGLEVIEVNASDFRNAEKINLKVGNAIRQMSLFSRSKVIIVDEVDGLSGNEDRGGIQAITKLIQDSHFPIILTAMDPFESKFSSLRSKSLLLEFKPLDNLSILKILEMVCGIEGIKHDGEALKSLARRSGGDARAILNDLQSLALDGEISMESLKLLDDRNKTEGIISALSKVFKSTDMKVAISAFDNVEEDINEQILWIDENLPKEYQKPEELARAYEMLSKADVFNRRIRRQQYYRFLVYVGALLTAGIADSKKERYRQSVEYKQTGRLLKIWWANHKSMKKKSIAEKIASKTHSSKKEILKSTIAYLPFMIKNPETRQKLVDEFELEEDEVAWLEKLGKR